MRANFEQRAGDVKKNLQRREKGSSEKKKKGTKV